MSAAHWHTAALVPHTAAVTRLQRGLCGAVSAPVLPALSWMLAACAAVHLPVDAALAAEAMAVCAGCVEADGVGMYDSVEEWVSKMDTSALERALAGVDERAMVQCVGRLLMAAAHSATDRPSREKEHRCMDWLRVRVRVLEPAVYAALAAAMPLWCATERAETSESPAAALAEALVTALPRRLGHLGLAQLADALDGFAGLPCAGQRLSHQLTGDRVADFVLDHVDHVVLRGPLAARLLHALSRLHVTRPALYRVVGDGLMRRPVLATLHRGAMLRVLTAFGRARFLHPALVDRLSRVLAAHADELGARELLAWMRAHGRLGLRAEEGLLETWAVALTTGARWARLSWLERVELLRHCADTAPHRPRLTGVANEQTSARVRLVRAVGESVAAEVRRRSGDEAAEALVALVGAGAGALPNATAAAAAVMDYLAEPAVAGGLEPASIVALAELLGREAGELSAAMARLLHGLAQVAVSQEAVMSAEGCRVLLDALGRHRVHHPRARLALSARAREVSKEVVLLSSAEEEEMQRMIAA